MPKLPRTLKLYARDGKLVKEFDLPPFLGGSPDVVFYGARAFSSMLLARGEYTECSCWRAPDERCSKCGADCGSDGMFSFSDSTERYCKTCFDAGMPSEKAVKVSA